MRFRDGQTFCAHARVGKFLCPLESSPVEIFTRDHFLSSSFGQTKVYARAHVLKFPGPPVSSTVEIFALDRFPCSSFGLIVVPVRFRDSQIFSAREHVANFPVLSRAHQLK